MIKITNYNIVLYSLLVLFGCADSPTHTNIFDPDTPNENPTAVELRTDLITDIIKANKKIGVFPINDDNWIDTGQWAEYKKAVDLL